MPTYTTISAGSVSAISLAAGATLKLSGAGTAQLTPPGVPGTDNALRTVSGELSFGPYSVACTVLASAAPSSNGLRYYTIGATDAVPPGGAQSGAGPLSADSLQGLVLGAWNPPAVPRASQQPIPVGTFGDSIANISSYANHDLRQISGGAFSSNPDRMGVTLQAASAGALRVMFNGGVSGETTGNVVNGMLYRDGVGATSTRKALTDAMTLGVRHLVFSAGINDLQHSALPAGSSSATIDSTVAASVANLVALCRRAVSFGMTPHVVALMGYRYETVNMGSLPTNNAAAVATTQEAIRRWNALAKATIQAAGGTLGYWYDIPAGIVDSSGAWLAGMDQGDGLHPSENCQYLVYQQVADAIRLMEGLNTTPLSCYPPGVNLFANSDFSASSAGQATGVNAYMAVGTGTLAKQIITWRGQQWQEVVLTPTGADGNGNCGVQLDLTYTTATTGDVLGGELSVYVDDGAGGPPPGVFQWMVRTRAGANYAEVPSANGTISPKVNRLAPIDRRCVCNPIVVPATPTPALLSLLVYTQQLAAPVRVRISRPRATKLATAY